MASTVLPNGIIIPEKYSRDWYNDLYHNWQELDNLLGGGTPKDGTLTIQKNGSTVGTFSANQSTNETINITVPTATSELTNDSNFVESSDLATVATSGSYTDLSDKPTIPTVNNATLTIQRNGATVDTFSANSSSDKTVNIQCVDLSTAQTIGGVKTFSSNMVIQGSKKVTCNLDNSFIELDGGTTWGKGGSIVLSGQDRSSYNNSVLIVSKSDTNTDILQYQNGELKPLSNNTNNSSLGTSTNKWKSFNGVNPGALSLPSTNLINIASSITALDGVTINKFTPQVDGWLLINGTGLANDGFIYAVQGRMGMVSTNNTAMRRCAVLIPVVAGVEVNITCKLSTLTWANIVPCQGNV